MCSGGWILAYEPGGWPHRFNKFCVKSVAMITVLFAYLDPGSGSLLLQAILGGGAGLAMLVRHVWRSFRVGRMLRATDGTPADVEVAH